MKKIKVAINGFGRIGRLFFRLAWGKGNFEITALNDLGNVDNLAYLLKYDTVYGRFPHEVKVAGDSLFVEGKEVKVFREREPGKLPWGKLGIDVVVEATGVFESFEKCKPHLEAGARHVVLTAPAEDDDGTAGRTVCMGINEKELKSVRISSNASCTTNAVALLMKILKENPGVKKAILNTAHAYTATQNLVDGPTSGKDLRRGRAAAQNIVPSSTGAAKMVGRVIPELAGKFDGIALRVPLITGSIADVTFVAERKTSVEEINAILEEACKRPECKDILKVTREPLVSSDIIGEPYGAIVDLTFTRVIDGDLVKVLSWYDNEMGYVSTLVKHVERVAEFL